MRERTSIRAMGVGLAVRVGRLGEACLLAGRVREAVDHGQREASALRLLGAIASHPDSPDVGKAESHYRQALALADELGMRPLAAHCHFGLGLLYRRTGGRQAAHEHLTIAQAMYRELSMRSWLEQAKIEVAGGAS